MTAPSGVSRMDVDLPLGDRPSLWDEFSPTLYLGQASLTARFAAESRGRVFSDARPFRLGQRSLGIAGRRFTLNGRPIFLRGTLECCIFPRTGYPATDETSWARIFAICREYGLNHVRFHSWCPPEAAFTAADRVGFLLQVEAPRGDLPPPPKTGPLIAGEVHRIAPRA
jgi:beta-galactosidase/beta-glucuronidase